ncbi:MAG: translation elongation factor Ts [Rhodothermales bacterium]
MSISAKDVKRLRDMTGVGMMDCKKALEESKGDFDAAVELLRKKGQKVAAKRADREANEGLVVAALSSDQSKGAIAEINCETDFVARNDDFEAFANRIVELILDEEPSNLDTLNVLNLKDGQTVEQAVVEITGKIGEKIDVRRFEVLKSEGGRIVSYIHPGSRLGVLVDIHGNGQVKEAGTDVAMQVAAMNPVATTTDDVPDELKEKELDIAREAAKNEGKPEHIIDRIAEGKLDRYFKDNVLVEQPFVKDSSMTVREMLNDAGVNIRRFVRYGLGE